MRRALAIALVASGCGPAPQPLAARVDAALERALDHLEERQDLDGAWRSTRYSALASGAELTPLVLKLFTYAPVDAKRAGAVEAARAYLVELGAEALAYPVYTAAMTSIALAGASSVEELAARERWLALLRSHQLDERLGWSSQDFAYGGFGYSIVPPHRGAPASYDADLSSTLFALGALRVCGAAPADPAVAKALRFVERCQNLPGDGGFFMTPTKPWANKAGGERAGEDGMPRYASYGAMTADGLRALLRCGLPVAHERVRAAREWLVQRFDAEQQPGDFESAREGERRSGYYYWSWSAAHALFLAGERGFDWWTPLAEALLARQRQDGSFANSASALMEDDPLVATSLAAAALGLCSRAAVAWTEGAGSAGGSIAEERGLLSHRPAKQ